MSVSVSVCDSPKDIRRQTRHSQQKKEHQGKMQKTARIAQRSIRVPLQHLANAKRPSSATSNSNLSLTRWASSRGSPALVSASTLASRANPRLSLISRHLDGRLPLPALNTPFSTERSANLDQDYKPFTHSFSTTTTTTTTQQKSDTTAKMSSQAPHSTLLIPGPIEFDDAVLQSMSHFA